MIDGKCYYYNTAGVMQKGWVLDSCWYYLSNSAVFLINTTTPDGYKVNANGEGM